MDIWSKRDEITGEWSSLHNEKLYVLYSSANAIRVTKTRRLRWGGHVARIGNGEVHAGFWWVKLREERQIGRPRRLWEDIIKMDL
jgi:hypothetical protein